MFFLMLALPILLIALSGQPTIWSLPHLRTTYDRGATDRRESEHFQQQNRLSTEKERASQDPELRGEVDKYQQADRNGGEAVQHPENVDLHRTWYQYWDNPQPAEHCFSYGRREYTATLRNVPFFADWTEACKKTKVEIRGIVIEKPSYCEIKWPFGGVIGHWIVDSGEAACLPYWGSFTDKGCTAKGSRLRRIQSRLWNIQSGEDWMKMCTTAPAVVKGVNFAKPTTCDDRGFWGIYGIWEVEDLKC
ncbi:hypothetical protein BDQ12DRAFT_190657 [Crucibulum laeve]|uniref:C-type lectin domain-containing protein n=1 Tax=Crucibulum laeve TaxID=68775 RepID=A0A5C3MEA0_9AGAR|nr:hypothetical protein BDQ12DRAFT_190657 [Crucibulum laeve]